MRRIPDPEEDYEIWESYLASSDEESNNFRTLLIQVKKMAYQIKESDSLSGKLHNYTTHFCDI